MFKSAGEKMTGISKTSLTRNMRKMQLNTEAIVCNLKITSVRHK